MFGVTDADIVQPITKYMDTDMAHYVVGGGQVLSFRYGRGEWYFILNWDLDPRPCNKHWSLLEQL